jgi:GntR family transcriptional repressor for pyruvate dehydrogenase complex
VSQPVEQGRLAGRIAVQVERLIEQRHLQPGDRLPPERDMAILLRVSRPSLREAVRVLEAQGRLAVRHGRGVFVQRAPSERELRYALAGAEVTNNELFAMREVLEVPAAAWAAERITDSQLARLRAALDQMATIIEAANAGGIDFARLAELDVQFHLEIAMAAGNRFLQQTSSVLHEMLLAGMETTLTIPGRPARSRRDHERIYAALLAHDPAAGRTAARAHIRAAHAAAIRRVERAAPG